MTSAARLLLLVLWLLTVAVHPAAAHTVIERSSPASNISVAQAPREVDLWFSESVDPSFSSAGVYDASGKRISEPAVVVTDRRRMIVPLVEFRRCSFQSFQVTARCPNCSSRTGQR